MVRFARAEGSKGSNKKQLEEPTPWGEMVSQFESNKKKRKNNQEEVESGKKDRIPGHTTKKFKQNSGEQQQNAFQTMNNEKILEKKEENHPTHSTVKKNKEKKKGTGTSKPEYTITPEGKRVKVFRDGTERTWFDLPYEESDTMTRYEGMWVKKTMVGELDRLKATLQEEGLDKKGIMKKMMKAKRKAHRELRIELIYQQKSLVSEATGKKGEGDSVSRGIIAKAKSNDTKFTKKIKQKPLMMGNGSLSSPNTENSMQANQRKKKHITDEMSAEKLENTKEQISDDNDGDGEVDTELIMASQAFGREPKNKTNDIDVRVEVTPCQVNEEGQDSQIILTTQDDCKVRKKKKSKKDKLEKEKIQSEFNREDNDVDDKVAVTPQPDGKRKKEKKIKEERLETEVAEQQTEIEHNNKVGEAECTELFTNKEEIYDCNLNKTDHPSIFREDFHSKAGRAKDIDTFRNTMEETYDYDLNKTNHTSSSQEGFEENELMTSYDGYWVLRNEVEGLEAAKKMELETIYAARTDRSDTCKEELTQEEQLVLQCAMKKRKRFHHRKLLQTLSKMGKKVDGGGKRKRSDKKEDDSGKVAKFDGFWVKKEAADRLHKLRKKLYKEGLSQQEVDALIQKERRKEERVLKNERRLVCLNCRQPGHMVSACPSIVQAEGEGQPSICYTCGSTEHTSSTCNLKKGSEKNFSFATCYICGETGHISRQCPDNPRGLYPKGGACRGCGSVEHLAKDCPDLQKEKVESSIRLGRLKGEELEALDEDTNEAADQDVSPTHSKRDRPKVVKF